MRKSRDCWRWYLSNRLHLPSCSMTLWLAFLWRMISSQAHRCVHTQKQERKEMQCDNEKCWVNRISRKPNCRVLHRLHWTLLTAWSSTSCSSFWDYSRRCRSSFLLRQQQQQQPNRLVNNWIGKENRKAKNFELSSSRSLFVPCWMRDAVEWWTTIAIIDFAP